MDHVQEPGIPILVGDALLGAGRSLAVDHGGLVRFLGTFPGLPSLLLDPIDLLELEFAGSIEVPDTGRPPVGAELFQIVRDRRLRHPQSFADLALAETLQIELGHLLTTLSDGEVGTGFHRHGVISVSGFENLENLSEWVGTEWMSLRNRGN